MLEPNAASALFRDRRLSLGLMLPLRATDGPQVDFAGQLDLARQADELGFDAIWVRDVPLNGAWYPETFGHLDPTTMLGAVAARTQRVVLGTGATVLTLRHPLHVAKAAISVDRLSHGRMLLGLGSGDRKEEFAAFDAPFDTRRERFKDHWARVAAALEDPPRVLGDELSGMDYELRPAPERRIPMIAVGSAGQTLEWIARNADGWATYHRPEAVQRDRHQLWRRAVDQHAAGGFRSFSVATRIELTGEGAAPPEPIELGYRASPAQALGVFERMRDAGVHHLILNLVPNGRPPAEALETLAGAVLGRL